MYIIKAYLYHTYYYRYTETLTACLQNLISACGPLALNGGYAFNEHKSKINSGML